MLVIEYNKNNIYRYLKHFNAKYIRTKIGIFSSQEIDEYFFSRVELYPWSQKNDYYYILNTIDRNNIANIINGKSVFSGIVFNLNDFDLEHFFSIYNYCIENGKKMFFINNDNIEPIKHLELENDGNFKIMEGTINDI